MSHDDIEQKLDGLIDFSGIEKFLDTLVKRYASGLTSVCHCRVMGMLTPVPLETCLAGH
jgi:ABC-type polysaccharide/polyol phosphate transport system ATPase subunit